MNETKTVDKVYRRRLHPERTLSSTEIAQRQAEMAEFRQRCQVIFERMKPELIPTHYNWYIAIEPDSGDYFLDRDQLVVAKIAHEKYRNAQLQVFRINETGVCGTI